MFIMSLAGTAFQLWHMWNVFVVDFGISRLLNDGDSSTDRHRFLGFMHLNSRPIVTYRLIAAMTYSPRILLLPDFGNDGRASLAGESSSLFSYHKSDLISCSISTGRTDCMGRVSGYRFFSLLECEFLDTYCRSKRRSADAEAPTLQSVLWDRPLPSRRPG
jgi:hypothetical protein